MSGGRSATALARQRRTSASISAVVRLGVFAQRTSPFQAPWLIKGVADLQENRVDRSRHGASRLVEDYCATATLFSLARKSFRQNHGKDRRCRIGLPRDYYRY